MANEKFKGAPFFMNGARYIVPSLSFGQLEDNYDILVGEGPVLKTSDDIRAAWAKYAPILLLAINRNYPDVTLENLRDWIGLEDLLEMLRVIQTRSGMETVTPGE